ncbi:MAG: hypothetical protein HF314_04400 [Ignavibacteria bacterium]|jgi:hypothetical protein|nr:hypothetical protein [Ignavibacteria bacterium]MCU7502291.1 hypothetical protein [Ignavibacteria bacterium]MCU7516665.1 hypothetical protein [Ignavibacteria bacterium]
MKKAASSILLLLLVPALIMAQSNVNPDISLIGTFNTYTNFNKDSPDYNNLNFALPSMELLVEGNLNPYSKAAAVLSYEESFLIEELYAQVLRGLPLDIQVKAGKYLVPFGKINTLHPHAWPFLERPLFQQIYFGRDGFNDIGVDLSFILPTGVVFTSLELGIYKGDAIGKSEAVNPKEQESIRALRGKSPVFEGRLGSFFNPGHFSNIEAGISASYGIHSRNLFSIPGNNISPFETRSLYYTYLGADFKYRYKPDEYTALTIQGEGLWNHRDVARFHITGQLRQDVKGTINTWGSFLSLDYQFLKMFSSGAKYDFTYGLPGDIPTEFTLSNDDINKTHGISGWFAYYPVEGTLALRLELQHLIFDVPSYISRKNDTKLTLQLLFSLGPHKAHPF